MLLIRLLPSVAEHARGRCVHTPHVSLFFLVGTYIAIPGARGTSSLIPIPSLRSTCPAETSARACLASKPCLPVSLLNIHTYYHNHFPTQMYLVSRYIPKPCS